MSAWNRVMSAIGEARFIAILGGLEVVIPPIHTIFWEGNRELSALIGMDLLIILPGIVLLYGGYWLPNVDLRRETHPMIVNRCLAGIGVMLGVVGVLAVSTGLNRPVFTPMAGTALGSVAGFLIGINEARALSRAYAAEQAQREAEQHRDELRRERNLRDRIIETSPIGIVILNQDGSVRMANERAAQIFGISVAELEDLDHYNDPMFEATDTEGNPVEGGMFQEILTKEEAIYDVERQITRADGQRIWLSLNGSPLYDSSGDITAVIVGFKDITERKEYEQKLEQSNDRLRQFAYAASHDLQEPLRMVSSYLQLLEDRYEDDLDADAQEFIAFAVDSADRMREMVQDLLAYSRVEQTDQEFEQVDCEAIVERVLADLQVKIEETGAEIVTGSLPTVEADEQQLEQLFQNLISNALKYSDDEPRVELTAQQRNGYWEFAVTDNGIGIEPDQTDRIFEVFNRLHHDDEYSGTGIGLSLCQKIVENHGGDIWVDSEPGEGSTFSFTLPQRTTARQQEQLT